jgi:hypothetical protein
LQPGAAALVLAEGTLDGRMNEEAIHSGV